MGQRFTFKEFEDEIRRVLVAADVVEGADVRVCELGDRARFAIEAVAELRVGGEGGVEDLDRDRAIQPRVGGLVNLAL